MRILLSGVYASELLVNAGDRTVQYSTPFYSSRSLFVPDVPDSHLHTATCLFIITHEYRLADAEFYGTPTSAMKELQAVADLGFTEGGHPPRPGKSFIKYTLETSVLRQLTIVFVLTFSNTTPGKSFYFDTNNKL